MECKDCIYAKNLESKIESLEEMIIKCQDKYDVSFENVKDKISNLDKQNAVSDEQINSIFRMLGEIKDSIQTIAVNLENKPTIDKYTKKQIDEMESELKILKDEEGKTYKHIKIAIVTAIVTGIATMFLNKMITLF